MRCSLFPSGSMFLRVAVQAAGLWACGQAQASVVTFGSLVTDGDSGNRFPFGGPTGDNQRYQQVYGSAGFSSVTGPFYITQIAFRGDFGAQGAFSYTIANIQIDLSTTTAAVDALSATFASNVGANDQTVFSGSLTFADNHTSNPEPFGLVVNLTTPFLYNPAEGNLLMDVHNFSGSSLGSFIFLDSLTSNVDFMSRVYGTPGSVGAASGTQDSTGLATQFTTASPVPEPATSLFGVALLGAVGLTRSRQRVAGSRA